MASSSQCMVMMLTGRFRGMETKSTERITGFLYQILQGKARLPHPGPY